MSVSVRLRTWPSLRTEGGVSMTEPKHQDVQAVLHTIPLLAATCLAGFAMLQLLFSAGTW